MPEPAGALLPMRRMRSRTLLAVCASALLCLRCGDRCEDGQRCPGSPAVPAVVVENLAPGARVSGVVQVRALGPAGSAPAAVDFALDGAVFATARGAPFTVAWDSLSAENGAHALTALARDGAGATATSPPFGVSVLNAVGASLSVHTALGLPGAASGTAAWLSVKPQYVISYDGARRVPAWVSWQLTAAWLGPAPRQDDFRPDDTLPPQIPQAQLSDYAGSGWDRGHLCPSEDRTATAADNRSTFYLTNVVPQADALNGGPWEKLEAYLRGLALSGKELSLVAGGVFAGPQRSIGAGVAVPAATFKVAVVLDRPGDGIGEVSGSTRVIAVVMPNDPSLPRSADWRSFRVRPREVERLTGLRLFSDVPREVREVLLDRADEAP